MHKESSPAKKDELVQNLFDSLNSQRQHMLLELGAARSELVELKSELDAIKSVYGNNEIRLLMKKVEEAKQGLDLIKSEVAETKFELPKVGPDGKPIPPNSELAGLETPSSKSSESKSTLPELEAARSEMKRIKSELESARSSYNNNEVQSITKKVEEMKTLLDSLNLQRQSISEEIKSARQELESIKKNRPANDIQSPLEEIKDAKSEISSIKQEKNKLESELDDIRANLSSSKSELSDILSKIDNAKSTLVSLQSQQEMKKNDMIHARRELEFIEKELAQVHERDEIRKLVKASSAMIGEVNTKYLDAKKECEILRRLLQQKENNYAQK